MKLCHTSPMMNTGVLSCLVVFFFVIGLCHAEHENSLFSIHGSGTTNPSKCFWSVMDRISERSRLPVRLTYRAVGSGTGIDEFVNEAVNNSTTRLTDFGSGDLALPTEDFARLDAAGIEVVHFPVVLGAVSFFHSTPVEELKLTSCLLARIFSRDIVQWSHPDLVAVNPELATYDEPITVAHRVRGSSSTDSITQYINGACPLDWDLMVGKEIDWPGDTKPCQGSGGMTKCIRDTPGTIGYIDAGHGVSAGLSEVWLQNDDGVFLTSQQAAAKDGIQAAEINAFPESYDQDFGEVSLLNRPGKDTWPIVQMSYLYVRKNLSFIEDPAERSLLKAFVAALYHDDYIEPCITDFGFTRPSQAVRDKAVQSILLLDTTEEEPKWIFENDTLPMEGAGPYVLSSKRRDFGEVQRSELQDDTADLQAQVVALEEEVARLQAEVSDDTQLMAALVMSSIAFAYCIVSLLLSVRRWYRSSKQPSTSSEKNGGVHVEDNTDVL